ncbi:MAG: hypothetical protein J1F29_01520 [Lentimicrobiaceae bacterium]|nr:hypothetical protein [Lentimicrobiaceae bacterium]
MEALSVREYRNNLADSFTRADKGEQVIIRRKKHLYALISIGKETLTISPQLQARIAEAEKACREGRCVTCNTKEEIENYLYSL